MKKKQSCHTSSIPFDLLPLSKSWKLILYFVLFGCVFFVYIKLSQTDIKLFIRHGLKLCLRRGEDNRRTGAKGDRGEDERAQGTIYQLKHFWTGKHFIYPVQLSIIWVFNYPFFKSILWLRKPFFLRYHKIRQTIFLFII